MEAKTERPSHKPVFNIMQKETMGKELRLQLDELKLKLVASIKDPEKMCAHKIKSDYNIIRKNQPDMKSSEITSIMEENCWRLSMEHLYTRVYADTNSFMGNPKLIDNVKLKLLTVLHLGKGKQFLTRQVQSVHYSGKRSKFEAAEYSKCHSLELLLGKVKIRWKEPSCSEAKELDHLVWHKITFIHCCGIFILEIIFQNIYFA